MKLALLLVALLASAAGAEPILRPVDEARKNASFDSFRNELRAAIARRDADAVLAVADSSIKIGFGGDDGIEAFEREWKPRGPSSRLWKELGATLALGGTFDGEGAFVAPYVFSRWPEKVDSFEHLAVTGSGVRVRARPAGRVIGRLSYAIVRRGQNADPSDGSEWTEVRLANGRTGYVASAYLRSPVGYRASFQKKRGSWRLTMFLAGD
jgi:hypothetical protein